MIPPLDGNPWIAMIRTGILHEFRDFLEFSAPDMVITTQKQKYSWPGKI
jgi:hypothetical protein